MRWRIWLAGAALGAGIAGIVAGLVGLEGVFLEERRTAKSQVRERIEALELYAREAFASKLARALQQVEPQILEAAANPLADADRLLLVRSGKQLLPRLWDAHTSTSRSAIELFETLRADKPVADIGAASPRAGNGFSGDDAPAGAQVADSHPTPWDERLALRDQLLFALQTRDRASTERAVRAILAHRARYVLPARKEVPFVLAIIELLARYSEPSPILIRGLLRDGIEARDRRSEGLERVILERRQDFSADELQYVRANIERLYVYASLSPDAFFARLSEAPGPRVPLPLSTQRMPRIAQGGWYLDARPDNQLVGVQIDLDTVVRELRDEMLRRGLIGADDSLALATNEPTATNLSMSLASLRLRLDAPGMREAAQTADRLFRTKSALVAACGLLLLALLGMAVVTQRRKRRLIDLKSRFVAAVSHELRTPLASTRLMAETLQRRLAGDPRAGDYPARIIGDVESLSRLVENVLSFSRIQKGQVKLHREQVNLDDLLAPAQSELDLDSRPGTLELCGERGLRLEGDRELLALLFANLTRNAVQHNRSERVELRITVQPAANARARVIILFEDNGVGIPEALWTQVFDDFERGASAESRGSGLGLALCREIAALHGGSVRIERSAATGTSFRVELPWRP